MRYRFVREHSPQFPITALCRVLEVSSSGYYAWARRPASPRQRANRALTAQIRAAHVRSRHTYGRRRVHAQLRREGVRCSPKRVARLMRQEGLCGLRRRAFRTTTDSRHRLPVAENLLARNFAAAAPDQVWVSDITYLACEEGWEYLATVMDLYSRRIVGWAMQSPLERSLTLKALEMAITQRRPAPGLIPHSDRGVQSACSASDRIGLPQKLSPACSFDCATTAFSTRLATSVCSCWTASSRLAGLTINPFATPSRSSSSCAPALILKRKRP